MLSTVMALERETADLSAFYRDVRTRVRGLTDSAARQDVIKELYGRFIKEALPEAAESLGYCVHARPRCGLCDSLCGGCTAGRIWRVHQ